MTKAMTVVTDNMNMEVNNVMSMLVVDRWLNFIDVSPKSKEAYTKSIKQLFKYFAENNITQPTRDDIIAFRNELMKTRKPSTVQLRMVATRLFFRWLSTEGVYANVADHIKAPKIDRGHKRDALTMTQSRNLLTNINTSTLAGLRDKAIITLCLTAGLRTIEIVRANVGDLYEKCGRYYLKVQGKGHTDRNDEVLVSSQVYNLIQAYLIRRGELSDDDALFASVSNRNNGKRLTSNSVSRIAKNALRNADIDSKRISAHSMRHFCATQALLNGVNITQVQQTLRHQNINTTMTYVHAIERMKNTTEQIVADSLFAV